MGVCVKVAACELLCSAGPGIYLKLDVELLTGVGNYTFNKPSSEIYVFCVFLYGLFHLGTIFCSHLVFRFTWTRLDISKHKIYVS